MMLSVPDQGPLGLASEVPALFNNKDLPSTSGKTTKDNKDKSNRLYVLGVSWTTLTNNSKEDFSWLVLEFLLGGLQFLERALSAQV